MRHTSNSVYGLSVINWQPVLKENNMDNKTKTFCEQYKINDLYGFQYVRNADRRKIGIIVELTNGNLGWSLCNEAAGDKFNINLGLVIAVNRAHKNRCWNDLKKGKYNYHGKNIRVVKIYYIIAYMKTRFKMQENRKIYNSKLKGDK